MPHSHQFKYITPIAMIFLTAVIVSNIIAIKIIQVGFIEVPAAIILYPMTFIIDDIFTEVYGYVRIRPIIWLAFLCNVFAVICYQVSVWLPGISGWSLQSAYAAIMGQVPRIVLASFIATPTGQFVNAYVLAKLKLKTEGRYLALRLIVSTAVAALVDSVLFIGVGFSGIVSLQVIVTMIVCQTCLKVAYEFLLLPVSTRIIAWLKRQEQCNYFDKTTNFNPFKWR